MRLGMVMSKLRIQGIPKWISPILPALMILETQTSNNNQRSKNNPIVITQVSYLLYPIT